MKYWWLEKYRHLQLILLPELVSDLKMFVVMPKDYEKKYLNYKKIEISNLREEELLVVLYYLAIHRKVKNGELIEVIDKLLEVPDNSMPISDYSLEEMIKEISKLKKCLPLQEKLAKNNVGACYNCLQVFYLDKIHYVNQKGICLCPYCSSKTLYFDNDYIPMDFFFLKLAQIYYGTSVLGCKWKHLQKLLKKSISYASETTDIKISVGEEEYLSFIKKQEIVIPKNKVYLARKTPTSREEMCIWSNYYQAFSIVEDEMVESITIVLEEVPSLWMDPYILSIILLVLEFLGKNPYLKRIVFESDNVDMKVLLEKAISTLCKLR